MSNEWRLHPSLQGRFHPDAPDDLQVIVHNGGPRITKLSPELVWVRVTGIQADGVFNGAILNQPQQLKGIMRGDVITFLACNGGYPVMTTSRYLKERANWEIHPCNQCGFNELLDAPSDLMKAIFPNLPAGSIVDTFTSFCGLCGGIQGVQSRLDTRVSAQPSERDGNSRPWWRFWS